MAGSSGTRSIPDRFLDALFGKTCNHRTCSNQLSQDNRNAYCSEWCYKNDQVLGKHGALTRQDFACYCGRHRGIKKDGTMYKYCSQECHENASRNHVGASHSNYQERSYLQIDHQRTRYEKPTYLSQQNSLLVDNFPWGTIFFYDRDKPYYEFTNFYIYDVHIDENIWHSTEHYFQAQKFIGTPYYYQIRDVSSPRQAFEISRVPEVSVWKRKDWERVKDDVMLKALLAKFLQNEKLRTMLVSTGSRHIVENSPSDCYWGIGGDGNGKNRLGLLLMDVRKLCFNKPRNDSDNVPDLIVLDDTVRECREKSNPTSPPQITIDKTTILTSSSSSKLAAAKSEEEIPMELESDHDTNLTRQPLHAPQEFPMD